MRAEPARSGRIRSRASSRLPVTQIGSPAMTRGAGRPASAAAAVIWGTTWRSSVLGPVIHVTVPSESVPARRSIFGPRAATTRPGGATGTESLRRAVR